MRTSHLISLRVQPKKMTEPILVFPWKPDNDPNLLLLRE